MAEETARLDRAIEQVVTAPYVPSLQVSRQHSLVGMPNHNGPE